MGPDDDATRSFGDMLLAQVQRGVEILPEILAALLILVAGWAAARLARRTVKRLALASNRLLMRVFQRGVLADARVSTGAATLLGEAVFWLVVLITLTVAARIAGLTYITGWLDRITDHLPNLIAGVAIFVSGYFIGIYVREQLAPAADQATSDSQRLLGRVAQMAVVAAALIVGLDQVGIDVGLLVGLAVAVVAATALGLSMAFALGARVHVSNLIGARVARRHLGEGLRVRIGDVEGDVLEITPTQIALNTDTGKMLLPASFVDSSVVTVVAARTREPDDAI